VKWRIGRSGVLFLQNILPLPFMFFILNSIIVASGTLEQTTSQSTPLTNLTLARYLSISIGAGFAFALASYTFFPASEGHITPAISFAMMWSSHITPIKFLAYTGAQVLGALVATGFVKTEQQLYFGEAEGGRNIIQDGYDNGSTVGIEVLTTFILCMVALSVFDRDRKGKDTWMGHLALGFVVLTVHLIALPIDGASMNPARSFASSAVFRGWASQWTWWLGPLLGGFIASVFYEIFIRKKGTVSHPQAVAPKVN